MLSRGCILRGDQFMASLKKSRGQYIEFSIFATFLVASIIGALALKLPFVHHTEGLSLLDAFFTATSAVCVTGLSTVTTSGFNLPGQIIIIILIQLGGIGIMTLTSSLILFYSNKLNLRHRMQAARITDAFSLKEVEGVLTVILKFTLLTELLGMFLLTAGFLMEGYPLGRSLYLSMFHSISAFCNAGFSTFDASMIGQNDLIKLTVMVLIVLGGLGYYVIFDFMEYFKRGDRITIHSKIVIGATIFLIFLGTLSFLSLEKRYISLIDAAFQAVTARTAGFNTIDISNMHTISLFILIILMIIGAAPGSTGGGVKLTTFFVAMFSVYSALRGHSRVVIMGRRLPQSNILRSFALIVIYVAFLVIATGFLLYVEDFSFLKSVFEVTSALGTVGLSLGVTPSLSNYGKIIIIVTMLAGRIGPSTMALLFLRSEKRTRIDYPEEKLILS